MNLAPVEAWLREHCGLEAAMLGAGVVARAARARIEARGGAKVEDYVALLATSDEERHLLIDDVIVPETWFFRDRPALEALARYVVESWGPAHPGATFNVLSVPCSTGEEPYSIVMALAAAGWPVARLRVDAVDISRENVARARAGLYGKNSFRGDDMAFRGANFELEDDGRWRVAERVRAPVRIERGNLLAEDFAVGRGLYDAIFCRNLLIYFDRATQARAIRALDRLLAPGGWIAVGPAEPVLLFEQGYAALPVPAGFLLHRAPKRERAPAVALPRKPASSRPRPSGAMPPAAVRGAERRTPSTRLPTSAPRAPEDTLETIRALADAGRLAEAAMRGSALLERRGASAELLYLLAVVADAAGEVAKADEFYRKTLYLDSKHVEALAHLALLAERNGDLRAARQWRERAQRVTAEAR